MAELRELARVLRHRFLVVVLLTGVGVGAAALWLARTPDEYVATTRLFISGASATSQYDAQQGGIYAQDRVVSYEQLVDSRTLAQRTIDALGLDMDAETLAARVTSKSIPDAAVMDVSVTADTPTTARDIANGLADQFIEMASSLETPPDSAAPIVRLTIVDAATDGTSSRLLPDKLVYIFGGLVGLFVGLIVAFVWENHVRRLRGGTDVDRELGEPPVADLPASLTDLAPASRAEAIEAMGRLRVNIATEDGSTPRTIALAGVPGRSARLARRFAAEAGLNLASALAAENSKAVLLVLDPSPDIEARLTRRIRAKKAAGQQVPIQWGFDAMQGNAPLDRDAIVASLKPLQTAYEYVVTVLPPLSESAHAASVATAVEGVVAVGIYQRTRGRDVREHMAVIHRTGANSLGMAFARRTLIPRPSRHSAVRTTQVPATQREAVKRHSIAKVHPSPAFGLNHR